jgi:glycosyltransferase involved in cell wall biosynthesis
MLGGKAENSAVERHRIAVLVPCYNEEQSIVRVIEGFRAALPHAPIYIYDNNSTDKTVEVAAQAGAVVRRESHQGKGHVVRRMFTDVEADIYVLVDGDATYDAPSVRSMVDRLLEDRLDMVVGARVDRDHTAYRRGHRTGNRLLTRSVTLVFGRAFTDILSGYRVFSRRFVKSFPVLSGGFEIETELTVHALELELPVAEIQTPYYSRGEGSTSKLHTGRDGFRILWTILRLLRSERPFQFFSSIAAVLAATAVYIMIPVFSTFMKTGLVPRLPTAVLATGLMLAAALSFTSGLILDTVTRGRRELKLLAYLAHSAPGVDRRKA